MPSRLAWLDNSEKDRQRIADLVDQFKEQDTRDELGLGAIRDAIADLLFPGTGTVQTRARYFLFVPWIYLDLERREVTSQAVAKAARRSETRLIEALKAGGEEAGVIGVEAGPALKRLPSSIYWIGLGAWGIRRFHGAQSQYHRSLDGFYSSARHILRTDDKELLVGQRRNWHAGIPTAPDGLDRQISFDLSPTEAHFLRERIITEHPGTMLALLAGRAAPWDPVPVPWDHPIVDQAHPRIVRILRHAQCFSHLMHGAAYLYNLLVAEKAHQEERITIYHDCIAAWRMEMRELSEVYLGWDRADFWRLITESRAHLSPPARAFVDLWAAIVLQHDQVPLIGEHADARSLVANRERSIKGARSRLDNPRARELWSGAAGTARMVYRWNRAQQVLLDIVYGIVGNDGN